METVDFVADKIRGFTKSTQEVLDSLVHGRPRPSARRHPIEILKRLQREAFSDLMRLRDRQDKVEKMVSLYGTSRGSPFQEASTLVRGEVDLLGAFLFVLNSEDEADHSSDALTRAGMRTGVDSKFAFETTVRENDTLVAEFVAGQKHKSSLSNLSECPLSLAKVSYTANVSNWLSAIAIPVGARCRDVAVLTSPSHQGKGLTDLSSFGPPLLNQHNGSAIGLVVKKSNVVASLAQFVSGLATQAGSGRVGHCLSTFGQIVYQLPGGTKLSLLGLHQIPKLSSERGEHRIGVLTIPLSSLVRRKPPETTVEGESLCQKKLKVVEIVKFRDVISNEFYFQMYYDDLPVWGYIGKVEDESWEKRTKYYLFTHLSFDVLYNGNQVIEIHAFSDPNHAVDITEDVDIDIEFTYSVNWNTTSTQFQNRMDKYSKASLLPVRQKIHWFSFINSIIIIVLLMGLLTLLIMRRLKNDLRKFSNSDEEEDKEVGWKYIHGDVFRYPPNMPLFCAVLGVGTQLLAMLFILFLLALFGVLYPYNRGALFTSLVFIYTLTSIIAGYTASAFHNQFSVTGWERSVLLTAILYLGPLFVTSSILNTVAISYGATAAIPFGTLLAILLIYAFLVIPLLAFGGVIGYCIRSEFQAPCAIKQYPREIPQLAWYRRTPCQMFIGGLLPFSAIAVQLHHLYASMWGYKIYTLPGILFVTFIILIIMTAILTVGLTYIQLSVEDHEWWWRSVLCGGSTAIFMFAYSMYFYSRSKMTGFMQLSFFIGYNACMCYAFFLMLGGISFRVSLVFVRHIYGAVKSE